MAAALNEKLILYPVSVNGFVGQSSGSSEYITARGSTAIMDGCISRLKKNHDILDVLLCSVVIKGLSGNLGCIKSLRNEMIFFNLVIDSILDELASLEQESIMVSDVKMHNSDTMAIMDCLCGFHTVSSAFELTVCVLSTHRAKYKQDIEKLCSVF